MYLILGLIWEENSLLWQKHKTTTTTLKLKINHTTNISSRSFTVANATAYVIRCEVHVSCATSTHEDAVAATSTAATPCNVAIRREPADYDTTSFVFSVRQAYVLDEYINIYILIYIVYISTCWSKWRRRRGEQRGKLWWQRWPFILRLSTRTRRPRRPPHLRTIFSFTKNSTYSTRNTWTATRAKASLESCTLKRWTQEWIEVGADFYI